MAIPDYQTLMLPLLKRAALREIRVLEAEKNMGDEFGLTPEERAQLLPSGKQRVLHNRAHWAKFYMMKAVPGQTNTRPYIYCSRQNLGERSRSCPIFQISSSLRRSTPEFPANREIYRESCKNSWSPPIWTLIQRANSVTFHKIPCSTEQEIFAKEQGICRREQGIWPRQMRKLT
jgi:restriction endonuclease Mrr